MPAGTQVRFSHMYHLSNGERCPLLGEHGSPLHVEGSGLYRIWYEPRTELESADPPSWLIMFKSGAPPQCGLVAGDRDLGDDCTIAIDYNCETKSVELEIRVGKSQSKKEVTLTAARLESPAALDLEFKKREMLVIGFFEVVSAIIGLAMSAQTAREYKARFAAILSDTNALSNSMTALAAMIRGVPNQVMLATARGYMESAKIKLVDADNTTDPQRKIAEYRSADNLAVLAVGALEGTDADETVTTGLLGLAISLRLHILLTLRHLTGDPDARRVYLAFAQSQATELANRCWKVEQAWDSRRMYPPNQFGGYYYVVDGEIMGSSNLLDPIAPMVDSLLADRRSDIYPTLHPMYKAVARIWWGIGRRQLWRFDNGNRVYYTDLLKIHPIYLRTDLKKWFDIDSPDDVNIGNDSIIALFNTLPIGAPITEDRPPYVAEITNWSHAALSKFPYIVLPTIGPQNRGKLWRVRGMSHIWWSRGEGPAGDIVLPTISWIASPALVGQYFSSLPAQEVDEYTHNGTHLGKNIDIFLQGPNT